MSAGCSAITPLGLLGGGPNVAANTQIGRENNQGINTSIDSSIRPVVRSDGPVETIDQSNTTNNTTNVDKNLILWLVIIGLIGWILPTPNQIGLAIFNAIKSIFKKQ